MRKIASAGASRNALRARERVLRRRLEDPTADVEREEEDAVCEALGEEGILEDTFPRAMVVTSGASFASF